MRISYLGGRNRKDNRFAIIASDKPSEFELMEEIANYIEKEFCTESHIFGDADSESIWIVCENREEYNNIVKAYKEQKKRRKKYE